MAFDFILRTRLQPPQIRGKILNRARLLELLKENLDKKLILICADAGYGKTTLLAQCYARLKRPFVFYSLDASDNDLASFFNYLIAGMNCHCSGFGQRTRNIVPQTRNVEIIVGTFINEFLEHVKQEMYVILDDYHNIQGNQRIGNALDYLLRHLPANLHLIISSRSTPLLNLAYYYAKQELLRIEREQLQFTTDEIQALLKDIYGLRVSDADIERIAEHSEGWITAIQLILQRISASGEDKAKETLNGYVASGEELFDYFARDVFDAQPEAIREFLMKTSILGHMNAEVCDALLGIRKSRRILTYLAAEHIFTIRGENNFKYHSLFRGFLSDTLKATFAGKQITSLYRKAGRYFSKIKDYAAAIEYHLLARDWAKAARCLEQGHDQMTSLGKYDTFYALTSRVPLATLDQHPFLLFEQSRILSFMGKWHDALKVLYRARRIFKKQRNNKGAAAVLNQIGFVYLLLMQPHQALVFERKALKMANQLNLKARILINLGKANRIIGKYDKAIEFLKQAQVISRKDGDTEMQALEGLAQVHSEKGDFTKSAELYSAVLARFANKEKPLSFVAVCANAASLFIELGHYERAGELLASAERLANAFNDWRTIVYASGIRGKLYLSQDDHARAIEQYQNTLELNKKSNERLVEIYARIDIASAYLAMSDLTRAKSELQTAGSLISPGMPPPILIDNLLLKGRLALAEKKSSEAENCLRQALKIAVKHEIFYQQMIILYHLSEFYLNIQDEVRTCRYLTECLGLARQKDYGFFLLRKAKSKTGFFEYALSKKIETDYVISLLAQNRIRVDQASPGRSSERKIDFDLDIQLFGRMVIKGRYGKILEPVWRTRKTKSLFACLIVNMGDKVQSDYLVENLWPRRGRIEGTHSLHEHISYLRRILGTMLDKAIKKKAIILYKNRSYYLNPEISLKVDVLEFEQLLVKAEKSVLTAKKASIVLYQQALDLYTGDFCLELDDIWSEDKRAYFRAISHRIACETGKAYFENKDYHKSLQYYIRALDSEPCDEDIHRTIMHIYSFIGDKTGVMKQYKRLEQILWRELKAKPSQSTQKLYEELIK